MDESFEQTQALHFEEEEEDDLEDTDREHTQVGTLRVLCQKGFPEKIFPLYEGDNVIGRHESCSISIPLKGLSREHACIEIKGDSVFIYDKVSRNRTRRNKHFLAAEVRYELKDKDKLTFGDVECSYHRSEQAAADDSGSETGSESMFETAPIDQDLKETKEERTLKLPADSDYSDASSDILEPTQPFGSQRQTSILKNNNSTLLDQNKTTNVTVQDTPAPSRTARITDNLVLPESDTETDDEALSSAVAPTLAPESQDSDEDTPVKNRKIMGAPTQAYVCESDDESEEEVTPRKKSLLMAATQAYVGEDDSEDTPKKRSLLTAATQAYVEESDDTTEEDTPVKSKRRIALEPTQAYTLAAGIEPTLAYDMDDSNEGTKEETEVKKKSLLFEPTQAYVGGDDDEDSNQGREEKSTSMLNEPTQAFVRGDDEDSNQGTEEKGTALMNEPTQAFPGKDMDGGESDTSEEFVLDESEPKDDDEDVGQIFMAPTLACDDVDDSNGSGSRDSNQVEETQEVNEDQTQVVEEADKKAVTGDDATQVFTDDATQAVGQTKRKTLSESDGETQVVTDETQVLADVSKSKKSEGNDEETQVFPDETQAVVDGNIKKASKTKVSKFKRTEILTDETQVIDEAHKDEEATQVVEDETLAIVEIEAPVVDRKVVDDSEQPTQVFPDATIAVEDICHQKKGKGKSQAKDDDATQVIQDDEEMKLQSPPKTRQTKGGKAALVDTDLEPATQIYATSPLKQTRKTGKTALVDTDMEPATQIYATSPLKQTRKTGKEASNEEATQMFSQPGPEDDSEREIILNAISTLAAEEEEDSEAVNNTSEDATQVVDDNLTDGDHRAVTDGDTVGLTDTVAITETAKIEEIETLPISEPEPTLSDSNLVKKNQTKGRGRKTGKGKGKSSTKSSSLEQEEATQVLDDTGTLPISGIEDNIPCRRSRQKTTHTLPDMEPETQILVENDDAKLDASKTEVSGEAATQVIDSTETDREEKPSRKSARQNKRNTQKENKATESGDIKDTKPKKDTAKVDITVEQSSSTRSRGRKGKQPIVEEPSNKVVEMVSKPGTRRGRTKEPVVKEEATQANSEEVVDEKTSTAGKRKGLTKEPVPQEEATQANGEKVVDKVSKTGTAGKRRGRTKEPVPQEEATQANVEDVVDKVSKPGKRKGRTKEPVSQEEATQAYVEEAVDKVSKTGTAGKRRGRTKEPIVQEEATQAYGDEEATQRYAESPRAGRSRVDEDEDLTPPLSEEMVPDSEEMLKSPVIPAPPLVRIPSRSPHKSALASPGRKKSPSPKRVQFVSQESKEAEPPARGRRGRKVQLQPEENSGPSDKTDQKETASSAKTTRRGRRSVQVETKTADQAVKPARSSLPAVLEQADSGNTDTTVSVGTSVIDNEDTHPKSRKAGRNTKKTGSSVKVSEAESKGDNIEENKKDVPNNKSAPTRSTRGKVDVSDDKKGNNSVDEKKKVEALDHVGESTGTRQSSRSKGKQTKHVESEKSSELSKGRGSRTKDKAEEQTSQRTRTSGKHDSQERIETSKRPARKNGVNVNSNVKDTETSVNDATGSNAIKQIKGSKHKDEKDKVVDSKLSEATAESEQIDSSDKQSRTSKRKGKETESKQPNEEVIAESQSSVTSKTSVQKQTKTSRKRGRHASPETQADKVITETTGSSDLKEITNMTSEKEQKSKKESKGSGKGKGKAENVPTVEEKRGKVTRGRLSAVPDGSGDSQQKTSEQTPAKRRKTTEVAQPVTTPKAGNQKASTSKAATPKHTADKVSTPVGTPKGRGTKDLDTSLSSSPSLRKTDHTKPRVMFTGVTDEQCEKIVKELGGELVSSVYLCTHLVTDQVRRTVKFLCCLSRGIPILTPQWLMSSKRTAVFSDHAPFLIQDHTSEKKFKFSLQRSLDKANEKPFLSNYKIHVTKSVKPEPKQMKDIIQCAGAQYLTTAPKSYSDETVVISCEDDKGLCDAAIKAGIPVVSAEFILTGALRQDLDINSYRLFASDKRKLPPATESEPSSKKRRR